MEDSHGKQMSYAINSQPQLYAFHALAKPILSEAIAHALHHHHQNHETTTLNNNDKNKKKKKNTTPTFVVADLGCSYGPNPLHYFSFISSELRRHFHTSTMDLPSFDLLYYFSDLPSNDFNSLFASYAAHRQLFGTSAYHHHVKRNHAAAGDDDDHTFEPVDHDMIDFRVFAAAMPGSFHTQLFPAGSLNFVVSAFTLHWLSQVPSEVLDPKSDAWNGGNVHIHPSRPLTAAAFARQSQTDLAAFLRCRAMEMATGATLFLLSFSVPNLHDRLVHFQCTMDELVSEGVISGEERDVFNVPMYTFNEQEIKNVVAGFSDKFELLRLVTHKGWPILPIDEAERLRDDHQLFSTFVTKFMGSTLKPVLRKHLGEERAAAFIDRYHQVITRMGPTSSFMLQWDLTVTILRRRP